MNLLSAGFAYSIVSVHDMHVHMYTVVIPKHSHIVKHPIRANLICTQECMLKEGCSVHPKLCYSELCFSCPSVQLPLTLPYLP